MFTNLGERPAGKRGVAFIILGSVSAAAAFLIVRGSRRKPPQVPQASSVPTFA